MLGGRQPEASSVGEVGVSGGWFDYDQKYFGDADPMTVPADLPEDVTKQVQELSLRAFAAPASGTATWSAAWSRSPSNGTTSGGPDDPAV